ncbi:Transcriptional regulatory protein LiaR [subsurface metagenome]
MTTDPIRVLLVDDHRVIREGLQRMLEPDAEIKVVGGAESGEEALVQAQQLHPDIILMDIKMPGMGGIKAIEAGAIGYLLKDVSQEELCQAIRQACNGGAPLASSMTRPLLAQFATLTKDKAARKSDLSERQLGILRLIATGATNKEIAAQLFLSSATIKREMNRIFTELDVSDRAEAVAEAYERKLFQASRFNSLSQTKGLENS